MHATDSRIAFHAYSLETNYKARNDPSPYWRRIHRQFVRMAIRELRYLTNRPTKRTSRPCSYGHGV